MSADEHAIEMERALLGCTTHCSGVLTTWHRVHADHADIQRVGVILLARSEGRLQRAERIESERGVQRERLLQPFIRALFQC